MCEFRGRRSRARNEMQMQRLAVTRVETERKVHALTFCFWLYYDHHHLQGLITAEFVFVASGSANDREWSFGGLFREWGFNVMFCVYLVTKEMGFMGI